MNSRRQDMILALVVFIVSLLLVRLTSPPRVTITWETASEVDAAGFHLYRSQSSDGSFNIITSDLIPADGDPLTGASYTYTDEGVRWGEQYYYQLEEVTLNGSTTRYPEIVQSRAGLGWVWTLAIAAGLAALSLLTSLWPASKAKSDKDAAGHETTPSDSVADL